ncbi:MAG TPA: hypothetical protein PLF16_02115 [Candidatus Staskawiczbacteria bacterium]|nr:hypothetical protein [Candidatus Staskawiczbacteria bacterium]
MQGKHPCACLHAFPSSGLYQHSSGPLMGGLDAGIPLALGKQHPDGNDAAYWPPFHYYKDQHGLLLSKSKPHSIYSIIQAFKYIVNKSPQKIATKKRVLRTPTNFESGLMVVLSLVVLPALPAQRPAPQKHDANSGQYYGN